MLDEPLGKWIDTERHLQYEMYRTKDVLYVREESKFETYQLESLCGTAFKKDGNVESTPAKAILTDGYMRFHKAYFYYEYNIEEQNNSNEQPTNMTEREANGMQDKERLIAVSDGSYDPISGKVAYAWLITTPGKTAWIKK